jgi:hypothetical protein
MPKPLVFPLETPMSIEIALRTHEDLAGTTAF